MSVNRGCLFGLEWAVESFLFLMSAPDCDLTEGKR